MKSSKKYQSTFPSESFRNSMPYLPHQVAKELSTKTSITYSQLQKIIKVPQTSDLSENLDLMSVALTRQHNILYELKHQSSSPSQTIQQNPQENQNSSKLKIQVAQQNEQSAIYEKTEKFQEEYLDRLFIDIPVLSNQHLVWSQGMNIDFFQD